MSKKISIPKSKPSEYVRLSLCMIVKNEADILEKTLKLAQPHVDEIVIVDTGSTDGTVEIAKKYADIYDEMEWPDSFSIARNYSMNLATGDYILILDADEYIEDTKQWMLMRAAILQPNIAALQVNVRNLMPENQLLSADCILHERVFRNHPELRYEGRIHNQIVLNLIRYSERTKEKTIRVAIDIVHTGYCKSLPDMKAKYIPRLPLLEHEYYNALNEMNRAYYGYQLGVVLFILEEMDEAAKIFNEIDYEELAVPNAYYAHVLGAHTNLKLSDPSKSLLHCEGMLALDRNEPIGYFLTGFALIQARMAKEGIMMLMEAYEKNKNPAAGIRFPLNEHQIVMQVGRICDRGGLWQKAVFFYEEYLKEYPDDEAITASRDKIVREQLSKAA